MTAEKPRDNPSSEDYARLAGEVRQKHFQLSQKVVQLESLYQAGLSLGRSLQVESVSGEFLLLAVSMVDARGGFLFLKDEHTGRPALVHQAGLSAEQRDAAEELARRRTGRVMRSRRPLRLGSRQIPAGLGAEYVLVAPVGSAGFIGVVDKETRQGIQDFTEEDAHLLELMGQQAGAALANARLYRSVLEEKTLNQNILASIGNGVLSTDLRGRIVRANPAVQRIFRTAGPLVGRSCARFLREWGCGGIAEAVAASLQDGRDRQVDDEQVKSSNAVLNARITPLRSEQGEVQGLVLALEDLTQERRLRDMFKQYASDQVVELLLQRDTQPVLGGEQRQATILFVDIRGSTALLGRIGAEEMVALLNECFTRLVEVVFQYEGTLDKYTGDGFMVVYGAPVALAGDSERAVQTALAIRQEMARFNRKHRQTLGLGIGISRGPVVAGNIGSLRRMEYTVIGPKVNLASRLCDRARAGQVWVDQEVYEELKGCFEFISQGRQTFKGTQEAVAVYEVLGPRGARRRKGAGTPAAAEGGGLALVDLSLPMMPQMELAAAKSARAIAEFMHLDEEKLGEIEMALVEACINAFEHSHSKDQRLDLHFAAGGDELRIRIVDRGHGFDVAQVRDRLKRRRESGERRRGWGLSIMEDLMDEVEIESGENGTTLTLVKRR